MRRISGAVPADSTQPLGACGLRPRNILNASTTDAAAHANGTTPHGRPELLHPRDIRRAVREDDPRSARLRQEYPSQVWRLLSGSLPGKGLEQRSSCHGSRPSLCDNQAGYKPRCSSPWCATHSLSRVHRSSRASRSGPPPPCGRSPFPEGGRCSTSTPIQVSCLCPARLPAEGPKGESTQNLSLKRSASASGPFFPSFREASIQSTIRAIQRHWSGKISYPGALGQGDSDPVWSSSDGSSGDMDTPVAVFRNRTITLSCISGPRGAPDGFGAN
jgi:hypothetical protein